MKIIQWYPGHMTKAVREMESNLKKVDAVIYLLDARAVNACINPKLDRLAEGKPVLYLINKKDTVEKQACELWIKKFAGQGKECLATDSASGRDGGAVTAALMRLTSEKREKYRAKGANISVRAMVVGIPNSGKSTLINSLCPKKKTVTGDKPGVTRGQQWISLAKGIDLLDTPGTLWPSFENQTYARHLAYIGSIKDDVLDKNELATELLAELEPKYPDCFRARYGELRGSGIEMLEQVAAKRGYLLRGGEADYDRAAAAVIDDFRKRRIGKIMLEYPDD